MSSAWMLSAWAAVLWRLNCMMGSVLSLAESCWRTIPSLGEAAWGDARARVERRAVRMMVDFIVGNKCFARPIEWFF